MIRAPARLISLGFMVGVAAAGCGDPTLPQTGTVVIESHTTGTELDPDGYIPFIDGVSSSMRVGPNGALAVGGLGEGPHELVVSDIASNCQLERPGGRLFPVRARDTTRVGFNVVCATPPGTIRIRVIPSGTYIDSTYYYHVLNAPAGQIVPGGARYVSVPPGPHEVQLFDVAYNCRVTSPNPVVVTVASRDTADVSFAIECAANATLRVVARTSGDDMDDRYGVSINGIWSTQMLASDSVDFPVVAGTQTVVFTDIATNCTPALAMPRSIAVAAGEIARLVLDVSCTPLPHLRVSVTTTGSGPATYTLGVDQSCDDWFSYYYCSFPHSETVPANGTVEFKVKIGWLAVALRNLPGNCAVAAPNPRFLTAPQVGVVETQFAVTCR